MRNKKEILENDLRDAESQVIGLGSISIILWILTIVYCANLTVNLNDEPLSLCIPLLTIVMTFLWSKTKDIVKELKEKIKNC